MNIQKDSNQVQQAKTNNLSVKDLQSALQQKTNELLDCQKYGNYVKADQLKVLIENLKKQVSDKKLQEMICNHKIEKKNLQKSNQDETEEFNNKWSKKMEQFNCQKDKFKEEMKNKHRDEIQKAKKQLQAQIPTKLKQSSECLNYRKIEEQMKKQKKYSQAHQIQQKIAQIEKKQKLAFEKQRQIKIQTALNGIKSKQKIQVQALNKKLETGLKELTKQKQTQHQKLKLKHVNSTKDLASVQEKQLLGQKGQIKSRVALSNCRSRARLNSMAKN